VKESRKQCNRLRDLRLFPQVFCRLRSEQKKKLSAVSRSLRPDGVSDSDLRTYGGRQASAG